MSLSMLVDDGYRLDPADLRGKPNLVTITNVSFQGLEEMNYVLHFEGIPKRLALNHAQWQQLAATTGSTDRLNWIGSQVLVAPQNAAGVTTIAILPVTGRTRRLEMRRAEGKVDWRGWLIAGSIVASALLLSTLYLQWQSDELRQLLEQLIR
jgi:hypothetical protein